MAHLLERGERFDVDNRLACLVSTATSTVGEPIALM
jgi:hypothetical protein